MSVPDPRLATGDVTPPDPGPVVDPGWYADPDDPRGHLYWDGARWLTQCERLVEQGHDGVCPGDVGRDG